MKVKTSVTLSEDILRKLDDQASNGESRSAVIERLLHGCLLEQLRKEREAKDLEIINRNAQKLTEEALDVLEYQEED